MRSLNKKLSFLVVPVYAICIEKYAGCVLIEVDNNERVRQEGCGCTDVRGQTALLCTKFCMNSRVHSKVSAFMIIFNTLT